jgi:hypothetical protein
MRRIIAFTLFLIALPSASFAQDTIEKSETTYYVQTSGGQPTVCGIEYALLYRDRTYLSGVSVEIMTRPGEVPNAAQVAAARALVANKAQQYGFGQNDVVGHGEIAPGHREVTEGTAIAQSIRQNGFAPAPTEDAWQPQVAQPGQFIKYGPLALPNRANADLQANNVPQPTLVRDSSGGVPVGFDSSGRMSLGAALTTSPETTMIPALR